jgi:hypothetical protein
MSKKNSENTQNDEYLKSWEVITKLESAGKLDEAESAQFEKARFTEEQVKKTSFVLGGQISNLRLNI